MELGCGFTADDADFPSFVKSKMAELQQCLEQKYVRDLLQLREENEYLRKELKARVNSNDVLEANTAGSTDVLEANTTSGAGTGTTASVYSRQNREKTFEGSQRSTARDKTSTFVNLANGREIALDDDQVGQCKSFTAATSRGELRDANPVFRKLVWHPLTNSRIAYDSLSLMFMAYELITIPLESSGLIHAPLGSGLWIVGMVSTFWWTADLIFSFCRGFQANGVTELRLHKTACAYLKSYFIMDLVIVSMDWVTIILSSARVVGMARGAKTLRFSRVVRLLRVLRLTRLPQLAGGLGRKMSHSELSVTSMQITVWILGILLLNHMIACLWYWLGNAVDIGWVIEAKRLYHLETNSDANNVYMYLTSLHWACTQFTPASMEVQPQSSAERLVAIIVIFSSLVMCSSFLTSITTTVGVFRKKKYEYILAHANLVRFLQENQIPMDVSCNILDLVAALRAQVEHVQRLHESDVALIDTLPKSTQETLKVYVYKPVFDGHVILNLFRQTMGNAVAVKICKEAMSQVSVIAGVDLFTYGAEAKSMYYVVDGEIHYYQGVVATLQETAAFSTNDFFCEQVLWMKFEHRGRATSSRLSELVIMDAEALRAISTRMPELDKIRHLIKQKFDAMLQDSEISEGDISKTSEELQNLVTDLGDVNEGRP